MKRQIIKNLEIEFIKPNYSIQDKSLILETALQSDETKKKKGEVSNHLQCFYYLLQKGKK